MTPIMKFLFKEFKRTEGINNSEIEYLFGNIFRSRTIRQGDAIIDLQMPENVVMLRLLGSLRLSIVEERNIFYHKSLITKVIAMLPINKRKIYEDEFLYILQQEWMYND